MQDVLVCSGSRSRNLATDEEWRRSLQVLLGRMSENERRWVAGFLALSVGWGGVAFAAEVTGFDRKTVRSGRAELENDLADCPTDRVRRPGAGRPASEKKIRRSSRT